MLLCLISVERGVKRILKNVDRNQQKKGWKKRCFFFFFFEEDLGEINFIINTPLCSGPTELICRHHRGNRVVLFAFFFAVFSKQIAALIAIFVQSVNTLLDNGQTLFNWSKGGIEILRNKLTDGNATRLSLVSANDLPRVVHELVAEGEFLGLPSAKA